LKLAVGLQKGGTGKSTSSMMLAFAIHYFYLLVHGATRRILVVDADPRSQTSSDWRNLAEMIGQEWPSNIVVIPWGVTNVASHVRNVEKDYDDIIIDTGGDNPDILRSALQVVDVLLMPFAASKAETRRIAATFEVYEGAVASTNPGLLAFALLVKTRYKSKAAREAREDLVAAKIPVADTEIRDLDRYREAFGTVPPDAWQYAQLLKELME
jgi:chromosome partitioning protein